MNHWEALAIFGAGIGAGTINAVVGSGTLITFPTLLAFGFAPVAANVSNNVGLLFGGITGVWGYRRELQGQRRTLMALMPLSLVGSVIGALLLLRLPAQAFTAIVPILIIVALVLVVFQPTLAARMAVRRAAAEAEQQRAPRPKAGPAAQCGTLVAGMYGGYFGAAQGVLLLGLLGSLLDAPLQTVNAIKNVLSLVVNGVAAVVFLVLRPELVEPLVVLLIGAGSLVGGRLGSSLGRRLPAPVLRGTVVVVGVIAVLRLTVAR